MTAHHTPAPWATDGKAETDTLDIVSPLGRVVMLDCSHDLVLEDARLIAAAPDLLAALQALTSANPYGNVDTWNECVDAAKAALAKATGAT